MISQGIETSILDLHRNGLSQRAIAKRLGVKRHAVQTVLRHNGLSRPAAREGDPRIIAALNKLAPLVIRIYREQLRSPDPKERFKAAEQLAPFVFPRRKAVEVEREGTLMDLLQGG